MKGKFVAAALALALFGVGSAAAEWFGPGWHTNVELTAQDRTIIRTTVQREIHGKRADTVASWTNTASGHSGTITLLSKSTRQGMPCEKIEYRITSSKPGEQSERYVFNSCRLPDGTWKLAD